MGCMQVCVGCCHLTGNPHIKTLPTHHNEIMSRTSGWVDRSLLIAKLKKVYGRDHSMMLFKDLTQGHAAWATTTTKGSSYAGGRSAGGRGKAA